MSKVLKAISIAVLSVLTLSVILMGAGIFVENHFYSRVATVQGFAPESDRVIFVDALGHYWIMDGIEDWMPGDVASLVMFDNGTAKVTDDRVIRATYQGNFSWIQ